MKIACRALVVVLLACAFSRAADGAATTRPSVEDQPSGISVVVNDDGRTLLARDKQGKVVWEADVIKKAGAPAVGRPVVRDLSLKDGKVTAIYGKHSFAVFDLKSGKLVSSGSD